METFAEWGYIGLFAACFIAATLIPMASEIVLSLFILTNYDFTTSIIVASLGSWVGGMSSYYLGWLGRWDIVEKYSKLTKEQIKAYQSRIRKWGGLIAFFSWAPVVGDPLAVALGFFRINVYTVTFWMLIGKSIRFIAWGYLTYWGMVTIA